MAIQSNGQSQLDSRHLNLLPKSSNMKSQNSIHKQGTVQQYLNSCWSIIASTSNRNDWKLTSVLVLPFLLVLNSCCRGIVCDCFDEGDTVIGIGFNMDSTKTGGFKRAEIENAIFVKYTKQGLAIDTNKLNDYGDFKESVFFINNFQALNVKTYQDTCTYRVINPIGNVDLRISEIEINGYFSGGCCSCYTNESISFKVNEEQYKQGGNGRTGVGYLINKN